MTDYATLYKALSVHCKAIAQRLRHYATIGRDPYLETLAGSLETELSANEAAYLLHLSPEDLK